MRKAPSDRSTMRDGASRSFRPGRVLFVFSGTGIPAIFPFRNPFQTFEQKLFKGGVISHESFVRKPGIAHIPFLEKSLELPVMLFDENVQGLAEFFVR